MVMLAVLVLVLGFTTFKYYNDYTKQKTEVEAITAAAVESATSRLRDELNAQHEIELKSPYEVYAASAEFNTIAVTYPRSWSSYVIAKPGGNLQLDGYFHPGTVPDVRGDDNKALRFTLERVNYADEVEDYQRDVEKGEVKAAAITVNGAKGVRLTGAIEKDINGILVILPIRDKTLKIWTQSQAYADDFNDIIIAKLDFEK